MTPSTETDLTNTEIFYNDQIEKQYLISTSRFIWLSIFTYNIYLMWWTYRVYRFFAQKENSKSNSAIKVIFNFIFLPSLLYKTRAFARDKGYKQSYSPILLYFLLLLSGIAGLLPIPFAFLLTNLSCVLLVPSVNAFNFAVANSKEVHSYTPERLSILQIISIIIGAIFWLILFANSVFQLITLK